MEDVAELVPLGAQVRLVVRVGDVRDRDLVGDRQPVAGQAGDLLGVVGEDADARQPEVDENLGADAVVAQVGRQPELKVRLDRVEALLLELVGAQLVEQADAAPLLAEVEQHSQPLAFDPRQRGFELLAAVAAQRVEHVAREAFRVDPDEHVAGAFDVALDERDVVLAIDQRAVAERDELTERRRQLRGDDALDQLLVPAPVGDQVRDRDHLQTVLPAVHREVLAAGHRAVLVLDLADHAGRVEPGEARQVDRRLGVSGALQDAARLRLQRAHVTGLDDVLRALRRVDRNLHRVRLVVHADPGRDPLARFDRDREGSLVRALVPGRHQLQVELVAALGGQRQADPAAGLAGHEVDRIRRHELGGDHQITLVLAVLVVDDDDHLAGGDVLDRPLDRRKLRLDRAHRFTNLSTYFASTSTSRLTVSPGFAEPRLVRSSVSGIRETVKDPLFVPATVSDTPSTAIDPFDTT